METWKISQLRNSEYKKRRHLAYHCDNNKVRPLYPRVVFRKAPTSENESHATQVVFE